MKKFINKTDDFLKESLGGFSKAHSDIIEVKFDPNFISRKSCLLILQKINFAKCKHC